MKQLTAVGAAVYTAVGTIGGAIVYLIGGWDTALQTLVTFMLVDYITGVMLAILNKSKKSPKGGLSSEAGLKGIFKKAGMLLVVIVANRIGVMAGSDTIRNICVIILVANEGLSIIENLGTMGVPVPKPLIKFIEALKQNDDKYTEEPISDEENQHEESEEVDT
jgi:toxin secretion/phage lysis holin